MSKYLSQTKMVGGKDAAFERLDSGVQDFQRRLREQKKKAALYEKRSSQRMREHLERLEARKTGKLTKTKSENKIHTGVSGKRAEQLRGAITAVKLFLASKKHPNEVRHILRNAKVEVDIDGSSKGDTDKKRVQNMDPWVIIPDEFVYQQILEIESPTGHSLARDGKRSYYTSDNLPMARLSSLIKYKIDKYVGPDSIHTDGSILRLSKLLKDIKGALSGLHSDDKKTNPVPRLFKKALNRLSNEEKEEFDRFLAVDTFGPRALFPYSQKDGCNTDTFDQLMGTPSKPTRQDYVPSRRAIDDDSWADNDIPVKMGKQVYCVTPSDKNDNGKNLAEASNSRAYHHMGELVDVDDDQKPKRAGKTLRDGEIYRDMAFCAPAIGSREDCESITASKYPLSKDSLSRNSKCTFDKEEGTCRPKWMKDKDNKLRKMFYREEGFADTEIAETNRQYAMAEKLRKSNRIQRRPAVDTSLIDKRWDTEIPASPRYKELLTEIGQMKFAGGKSLRRRRE